MLRKVDAGRRVLRLPVPKPDMDNPREGRFSSQGQPRSGAVDLGSDQLRIPASQQGWQEALRCGWPGARRTGALRREVQDLRAFSFGDLRPGRGLLEGRPVGRLRVVSRGDALAKQGRWE